MIPKLLKFKMFESYSNEQIIDFTQLSKSRIFLIKGETGAGKTAILDAITYSLYGHTSGGVRKKVRHQTNAYSDKSKEKTEVEFVFELKNKTYKFTRSIRVAKDGSEKTSQNCFYEKTASLSRF